MSRRGFAFVSLVLMAAGVIGIAVGAGHWLARSSGRQLFALQETRSLLNLGRSALAEAHHAIHQKLTRREARWVDWCVTRKAVGPRSIPVPFAQKAALEMGVPGQLSYRVKEVQVRRARTIDEGRGLGELELAVKLRVNRDWPAHGAELELVERRGFWRAMPFTGGTPGGRLTCVSESPLATLIEGAP